MKDDNLYFIHILERIERIESYILGGREEFLRSRLVQDAVIRNFEVIGEAAKRVSKRSRDTYPTVPWKRIAGFRDILIHQYEGVELEKIWNIITQELPRVKSEIAAILTGAGIDWHKQ
jgi:uncharacterized protein with HEPN domain